MPRIKRKFCCNGKPIGILAVVLLTMAATTIANAQTTLQTHLIARPLTPGEISTYKLPSTTETSPGLTTVGVGQPAYLEAQVPLTVAASDITGVTWQLTMKPAGSAATIGNSPLGANIPVYEPSDRLTLQMAGRALLRPDVPGEYVVNVTVSTQTAGTASVAQTFIASDYAGIQACTVCHSGGMAATKVPSWSQTLHSQIFKDGITGVNGTSYPNTCYGCHTVGYDVNTTAANGGFDKVAKQLGWTTPATMVPANWDALPADLKNLANIQCENCHGAGMEHAKSGGALFTIALPAGSGSCNQCHDAPTHHVKGTEWKSSMHAVTTADATGTGRETCVGCHTDNGFIGRIEGAAKVDTTYGAINCQTCHEPHGQTAPSAAPHLIRAMASVKLADGTNVTNAGEGTLCMNCHQSRQNAQVYAATTPGSAHFGPHEGPQADMLQGVNGFTYGKQIPTSAHAFVVKDTCVACHMQTVATTDPGFLQVGGHTFKPSATLAGTNTQESLTGACQNCHGPEITNFDFPLFDYNNDGSIEGVQTEVQHLLDQLSALLPPNGNAKTSLTIDSTWTRPQLEAAYNWLFVNNDGSHGVHNTAYAVGLLKASIADLSKK
jgi:cytochrome c1